MVKDILYGIGMTALMCVYPFVALPAGLGLYVWKKANEKFGTKR
jgi:hypothetical protein